MNKQEALKQIEEQRDMILELHGWGVFGYIKGIINQLDELQKIELPKVDFKKSQKVKVPEFVADWYEEHKDEFEYNVWDWLSSKSELGKIDSKFAFWLNDVDNTPIQILVNMHQFGYEVDEEKRYLVKVKGMSRINGCLAYNKELDTWYFGISGNSKNHSTNHTRKQLEEANFGWVFDCPGVEVTEVE